MSTTSRSATSVFLATFLLFSPFFFSHANAQILINEFMADLPSGVNENESEWVELYNTSDTNSINISGFVLADDKNNQLVISPNHASTTLIQPGQFALITRKNAPFSLNNTKDTVFLFESTSSAVPIDQFTYQGTKTNLTWGRVPDGGSFVSSLTPTPGHPNKPKPPTPSPTSKATSPQKITPTPHSANPPPKSISTPTSSNLTSALATPITHLKPTSQAFEASIPAVISLDNPDHGRVMGSQTAQNITQFAPSRNTIYPFAFILAGAVFIASAYFYYKNLETN